MKKLLSLMAVTVLLAPVATPAASAESQASHGAIAPSANAKSAASKAKHKAKRHATKPGRHHNATPSGHGNQVTPRRTN